MPVALFPLYSSCSPAAEIIAYAICQTRSEASQEAKITKNLSKNHVVLSFNSAGFSVAN